MSTGVEGKGDDEINFSPRSGKESSICSRGWACPEACLAEGSRTWLLVCMYVSCVGGTERTWEQELMAGSEAMGWKRRD
jgi:hypothetical protein